MKKKDNGEMISSIAPAMLMTIVVLVIVVIMSSWMANIERKQAVNQIARKYILQMETVGGLTNDMETALKNELAEYCENVSLSVGSNHSTKVGQVSYGEDIDLWISADLKIYDLKVSTMSEAGSHGKFMEIKGEAPSTGNGPKGTMPIQIHKSSTSKH